jgi:hypothetical protein
MIQINKKILLCLYFSLEMHYQKKTILYLSLPLAGLIILAGCTGLFTNDFYLNETANWKLQSVMQDAVDVFLVAPALIVTTLIAIKSNTAFLLWGGINFFIAYTYAIYCFDVHFNSLFVVYCFTLGLSFYSLLYFLLSLRNAVIANSVFKETPVKITAAYFIVVSIMCYLLWLSEILPAIFNQQIPKGLSDTALPTNPVHVLDLSVVLPAIFITGFFILKKRTTGLLLAPAILVFFILMDITIAAITIVMHIKEETGYVVAVVMSVLALFSLLILIGLLKSVTNAYQ